MNQSTIKITYTNGMVAEITVSAEDAIKLISKMSGVDLSCLNSNEEPKQEPAHADVKPKETAFRYLKLHEVIECTSLSKTTIYKYAKACEFPKPVRIKGKNQSVWRSDEVFQWMESRPRISF